MTADPSAPGLPPSGQTAFGRAEEDALLRRAAAEAARLLDADGAYAYLLDEATGLLQFRIDAGIDPARYGHVERPAQLAVGVGMVGRCVAERRVVVTEDYWSDEGITHQDMPDRFVREIGIRSMVAAPIMAGETVMGALGVFNGGVDTFSAAQVGLVRALADHAGAAIANARLIEELARSREALARQAALERSLRELGTRMAAAPDPEGVVQRVVDEAMRLMGGDGARIDILDPRARALRGVYAAGEEAVLRAYWPMDDDDSVDVGLSGKTFTAGHTIISHDYLADPTFRHADGPDGYVRRQGIRGAIATPLVSEDGPFATITVWSTLAGAFDERHVALLETIAGQASVALARARLIQELGRWREELAASEERYRYLVQASPDLIWMTDAEGCFTFISDQVTRLIGWTPQQLLGQPLVDLAAPDGRRGALARFRRLQHKPTTPHRSRLEILTSDGRRVPMELTGIGMVADGRFVGAHGTARDIAERERLERNLLRQAADLAASEERAHLSRELHDSVTQAMFSMTLHLRSIELLLEKDPAQVPARLVELRELQRDALAELRALVFELRPGNVEQQGLVGALRTHAAALSGRIGLPVVIEADLPERPSLATEEALYRIAQEALHNVVKHAAAHQARVDVSGSAGGVRVRVRDDGRGFDPAQVPDGHLGLAGMHARAIRLGGQVAVTSAPGQGTTVEALVPAHPVSAA